MLFTLGLDSEFGLMETVLTCMQDEFPTTRKYKSAICIGMAVACFFMALPCTCPLLFIYRMVTHNPPTYDDGTP
ncbi:unnamed protein product, partial [Lymnaea stagnalis]